MKTLKFKGTAVSFSFDSYQNNGSLAVLMNTVPDEELYGVITVNLGSLLQTDRLAFVDENNLLGIGAWLRKNKIAVGWHRSHRHGRRLRLGQQPHRAYQPLHLPLREELPVLRQPRRSRARRNLLLHGRFLPTEPHQLLRVPLRYAEQSGCDAQRGAAGCLPRRM